MLYKTLLFQFSISQDLDLQCCIRWMFLRQHIKAQFKFVTVVDRDHEMLELFDLFVYASKLDCHAKSIETKMSRKRGLRIGADTDHVTLALASLSGRTLNGFCLPSPSSNLRDTTTSKDKRESRLLWLGSLMFRHCGHISRECLLCLEDAKSCIRDVQLHRSFNNDRQTDKQTLILVVKLMLNGYSYSHITHSPYLDTV